VSSYPWYEQINGADLQQGDILHRYPIFIHLPYTIPANIDAGEMPDVSADFLEANVIVLTQSCDLAHAKVEMLIVCPVVDLGDVFPSTMHDNEKKSRFETIRQGKEPAFHMIACDGDISIATSIIDFRRIYTTPKESVINFVSQVGERVRLLPPYREHLSQAFARYFMRVGLPEDIPAFK